MNDTLWLKAHDYGAKAIVSPTTGATWRDRMKLRTTAFGQAVWSVSVPRDDDGEWQTGHNYGDFMADAWEESVLGVLPGDSAVRNFLPFWQLEGTDDKLVYADRDDDPSGRNIKGDGFCNWEEYRGFQTVGDQFGFYPSSSSPRHKRLNPTLKNALAYFMPGVEVIGYAPGYINALPDTMVFLIDSLTNLNDSDNSRMYGNRYASRNVFGAYYVYYGSHLDLKFPNDHRTMNQPASMPYQKAVVIWPKYTRNNINLVAPQGAVAYIKYKPNQAHPEYHTPNEVSQFVVRDDIIQSYKTYTAFYRNPINLPTWKSDKEIVTKSTIAHEFGHNIGMEDQYTDSTRTVYIMGKDTLIQVAGRIGVYAPFFFPLYSATSDSQITIK